MKTKIEIGSFARRKSDGKIVKVALAKYGWIAYDENVLTAKSCPMEELEPCDPKTAFLTRLQELLATFDATIYDYEQYKLCIDLGDGEQMEWYWGDKPMDKSRLAADNVFDYDND